VLLLLELLSSRAPDAKSSTCDCFGPDCRGFPILGPDGERLLSLLLGDLLSLRFGECADGDRDLGERT